MNELELKIMALLLAGDHADLAALRQQASLATVTGRDLTEVGVFTHFAVPPHAPRAAGLGTRVIGDVYADIAGLDHGAGFLLWLQDGVISQLECWIVDHKWPEAPQLRRAYYVRPAAGAAGALVETSERDLPWALGVRAG